MSSLDDLSMRVFFGKNRWEFMRDAGLKRNPESGRCPVCKSEIIVKASGDQQCSRFDLGQIDSEAEPPAGVCFWHRHQNGLNYWSDAQEVMRVLSDQYGIPFPESNV